MDKCPGEWAIGVCEVLRQCCKLLVMMLKRQQVTSKSVQVKWENIWVCSACNAPDILRPWSRCSSGWCHKCLWTNKNKQATFCNITLMDTDQHVYVAKHPWEQSIVEVVRIHQKKALHVQGDSFSSNYSKQFPLTSKRCGLLMMHQVLWPIRLHYNSDTATMTLNPLADEVRAWGISKLKLMHSHLVCGKSWHVGTTLDSKTFTEEYASNKVQS